MSAQVRTVTADEVGPWFEAVRAGFLERPATTSPSDEFRTATVDLDHTWAAVDDSRVVGTLRSFATTLSVPGAAPVSCAALTQVTVAATHRRQGLLSAMIESDLRASAARGDTVGALIAAEYPIYGRFGYGPAAEALELVLDARALRFVESACRGRVELVDRDTYRRAAVDLYDQVRRHQPGAIERPWWWWDLALGQVPLDGKEVPTFLALGRDGAGGVDGLLAYDIEDRWEHRRPCANLKVRDLLGLGPEATNRLWRYASQLDWVATVTAVDHRVDDPLRWALTDARAVSEADRSDLLWVRLLDLPVALAGRRYLASGQVVLEVTDPLGLAAGRVQLEGGPDGAECTASDRPADLEVSAATLASAYLGAYTLADLARGGRVREIRPGALATADAMFRTPIAPCALTHF